MSARFPGRQAAIACAVHELDEVLASRAVFPENVRIEVGIEIARANNVPRCRHRSQDRTPNRARAVHEQDDPIAGRVILPKNIRFAVAVKIRLCRKDCLEG